ncbi:MAG: hypothetical protein IPN92_19710 [Chromatiaceae bacterium]|nr:hypothetical protein [Chromatiaceae bacterium]
MAHGATTSFTVTPDTGYSIGTVSGCEGSLAGATYTTGPITAPCAVSASFVPVVITVAASDKTATEAGLTTGRYTITRTGDTAAALTLGYTVTGTATSGKDYLAPGTSVVIPAGKTRITKVLTPKQDTLQELPETVVLTLNPSPNYTVGNPTSATVTITSDEPVTQTVSVSASDASATEADLTTGRYTFTRAGSIAAALTVNYGVSGTATAAATIRRWAPASASRPTWPRSLRRLPRSRTAGWRSTKVLS